MGPGPGDLHRGWLPGAGDWGRAHQDRAARRPYGLHLRRRCRGVWGACLHGARRPVRRHCAAGIRSQLRRERSLHETCGRGPERDVRISGSDQHGGQCRPAAGQGHDPAVHFGRRLLAHFRLPYDGDALGPHALASRFIALETAAIVGHNQPRGAFGPDDAVTARPALLAAGGTGGHFFPAYALAQELGRRSIAVDLMTDMRGDRYGSDFPAREVYRVPSATLEKRSLVSAAMTAAKLGRGVLTAYAMLRRARAGAVVGLGGHPSLPPLVAAKIRGISTALHE